MKDAGGLPTGTVTFLFSDVEGSTRLLQNLGEQFRQLIEQHNALLRDAFERRDGTVVRTEGDAFFVVFPSAAQALAAAIDAQDALAAATWPAGADVRVRMGLHTGIGALGGDDYVGIDVHRAARIAAAGHGGQVLVSASTRALVEHDLPDGVALRDLGDHRLKDLLRPEHLSDVMRDGVQSDFPPLSTLTAPTSTLPMQTSDFLGRQGELAEIRRLLDGTGARLLTLTGPGGIGKTRLALQVAAEQADRFPDGVFFVELETVRDPEGVFEAIIRAAGLTAANDGRPLEAVSEQLRARQTLLLLDNLEQVIDAADGVAELLRACPSLWVLATSREALAVRGESVFAVPPMSVPARHDDRISPEAAGEYEAVRLFVARAREARPGFTLTDDNAAVIADICARLDGLPLAIELAAARVKLFSPKDLRDRLHSRLTLLRGGTRDVPARQRTLRGAIEWSYELLDKAERSMLGLLSLFSTARLEDVEAVADQLVPFHDADVLDLLTSLVDKSLVRSVDDGGSQRLAMFETLREYAAERLDEDPTFSAAARQAHAEHYCAFARAMRGRIDGTGREAVLDELDAEVANLHTAWDHWLEAGQLGELHELLETLWALHDLRGRYRAVVELGQELLAALAAVPSTPEHAEQKIVLAITVARGLMATTGPTRQLEQAYRRALDLLTEAGGLPRLFPALRSLASLHLFRAEFDKGMVIGRQLLELADEQDDDSMRVEANLVVGANLVSLGDMHQGLDHLDQATALFDSSDRRPPGFRLGPSPGVVSRTTSALVLWQLGLPEGATERADDALAVARELNHPFTLAYALHHGAVLALWREDYTVVYDRAVAEQEVADEHDYPIWHALGLILQGVAMTARGAGEQGLGRIDDGMSLYQRLETPPVFWPLLLAMRARSYGLAGRPAEGLAFIDDVLEMLSGRTSFLVPEMPLLKGDLLLMASRPDEAEPWFEQALDVGEAVGARMPQLRAATRLVRVRRAAGKRPDGSDRLREAYDTFTEGLDTPNLVAARALLDE